MKNLFYCYNNNLFLKKRGGFKLKLNLLFLIGFIFIANEIKADILNGSFTNGGQSWIVQQNFYCTNTSSFTGYRTAPGYAWFGASNGQIVDSDNIWGTLTQSFLMPTLFSSASIDFYTKIQTNEVTTTMPYDKMTCTVTDNTTQIASQIVLSNLDASTSYIKHSIPIPSSMAGHTLTLTFYAINDKAKPSFFRIDDVSLTVLAMSSPSILTVKPSKLNYSPGETVVFTGSLLTSTGQPITNAIIAVEDPLIGICSPGKTTDNNGNFSWPSIAKTTASGIYGFKFYNVATGLYKYCIISINPSGGISLTGKSGTINLGVTDNINDVNLALTKKTFGGSIPETSNGTLLSEMGTLLNDVGETIVDGFNNFMTSKVNVAAGLSAIACLSGYFDGVGLAACPYVFSFVAIEYSSSVIEARLNYIIDKSDLNAEQKAAFKKVKPSVDCVLGIIDLNSVNAVINPLEISGTAWTCSSAISNIIKIGDKTVLTIKASASSSSTSKDAMGIYIITKDPQITASITNVTLSKSTVSPGSTFGINYTISATGSMNVLLGASIKSNSYFDDASNDISVSLASGTNSKSRSFNLSTANPPAGDYDVIVALYNDKNNSGKIDAGDIIIGSYFTCSQKLTISAGCTAPAITLQPIVQTKTAPESAIFSITASGSNNQYQWQYNTGSGWTNVPNNSPYSGVNTLTLNINNTSTNMNGYQYRCYVISSCNSATATSNGAILYVSTGCLDPVITSQPSNQTKTVSEIASFNVTATGTNNSYQWQVKTSEIDWSNTGDGGSFSGSTTPNLTINSTLIWMNGSIFRCIITNSCSIVTSNEAILSVSIGCINPVITVQPSNQTKTDSETAIFSVTATGSNNLYQWQVKTPESDWNNLADGGSLLGSTSANLTINKVSTSINGCLFRCIISNSCSTVTSNEATLFVSSVCTAPSAPATCTTSIGTPANGLEHYISFSIEAVSDADGYSWDYSWDGISWTINHTQGIWTGLYWNLSDSPNIPIYFRVRAYKCSPVVYSNYIYAPQPIYTACDDPVAPSISGITSNSFNITLNAETPMENPLYTTYSIYCVTTNQYVQTNGTLGSQEVFQTKNQWGTKVVTGLMNNREYIFYAKARNNNGDIRYNTSNTVSYIISGINDVSLSDKIKIIPNPTKGKFEISEIESLGNECKVEIINNLGSLIYISVYKNFGNKISLDLSPYTEGLYFIRLSNNDVTYQKKVIKK